MNLQKEGIVYTPENITTFIAKTTIDYFIVEQISNKFKLENASLDELFGIYIPLENIKQSLVETSFARHNKELFKYIFNILKNLTVLDPSVGNGDLIIAALNVLESYFIQLKILKIIEWSQSEIRKYIITNILHGVDIETEAIKNTKQRLMLMLVELNDDINDPITLAKINSNYRVGNALVGFVRRSEVSIQKKNNLVNIFYDEIKNLFQTHKDLRKEDLLDTEKKKIVNELKPFHWFLEFPDIITNGGFDIIIQNPPYISNRQLTPLEKAIFEDRYKTPKGLMNTFGMFIERSIDLCHNSSRISNIVHKNLIRSNNYYLLRKFLLECTTIEEIIDLGAGVFQFVTAETIIVILKPKPPSENHRVLIKTRPINQKNFTPGKLIEKKIFQNLFLDQENYNINLNIQYKELEIIEFIKKNRYCELFEYFEAKTCIATGDDEKFLKDHKVNEIYKKTLRGKNIGRYYIDFKDLYVYYNPKALHRARDEMIFLKPEKLIIQTISSSLTVAYDDQNYYPLSTCIAVIPKKSDNKDVSIKYLLLFMNSKIINFYYDFVFNLGAHLTTEISVRNINKLPLFLPKKYEIFDVVSDIMVQLNKSKSLREQNKELIDYFDYLIDVLIYELVFTHKFKLELKNTYLHKKISQFLIEVDTNSIMEVKNCIKIIKNDYGIKREIEFIMNHHWVRILEDYFKK